MIYLHNRSSAEVALINTALADLRNAPSKYTADEIRTTLSAFSNLQSALANDKDLWRIISNTLDDPSAVLTKNEDEETLDTFTYYSLRTSHSNLQFTFSSDWTTQSYWDLTSLVILTLPTGERYAFSNLGATLVAIHNQTITIQGLLLAQ